MNSINELINSFNELFALKNLEKGWDGKDADPVSFFDSGVLGVPPGEGFLFLLLVGVLTSLASTLKFET